MLEAKHYHIVFKEIIDALKIKRGITVDVLFSFALHNSTFFNAYYESVNGTGLPTYGIIYRTLTGNNIEDRDIFRIYAKSAENTKEFIFKIVCKYDKFYKPGMELHTIHQIPDIFKHRSTIGLLDIKFPDKLRFNCKTEPYYESEDEYGFIPNYRFEDVRTEYPQG